MLYKLWIVLRRDCPWWGVTNSVVENDEEIAERIFFNSKELDRKRGSMALAPEVVVRPKLLARSSAKA